MLVSLNVYDVTNTANENANGMITRLNSITRELNLGGVFHGAVQLDDSEWSFGYCESGTGVYCCRARSNSLYTFREHIGLGTTQRTRQEIREILSRLKRAWPGISYDLLQRNCCHFCEKLCIELGVPSPPAWLNRFAQGADATVKFTTEASAMAKRVSSNISQTAQQSAVWLRGLSLRVMSLTSASDSDEGGESTSTPSHLDTTSMSGSSTHPWIGRREGAGVPGRLASRLRPSGTAAPGASLGMASSAAEGGCNGGCGGLPASTPSSSCDLASAAGPPPHVQSPLALSPALASLRQKWQELEATAGDGTKQFLFGLIKTRQTRLDEDEVPWAFPGAAAVTSDVNSATHGSQHLLAAGRSWGWPHSVSTDVAPAVASAAAGGSASAAAAWPELTQAPLPQVWDNTMLRSELLEFPSTLAAPTAAVTTLLPTSLSSSLALEAPVTQSSSRTEASVASVSGGASLEQYDGRPTAPPVRHLLDM